MGGSAEGELEGAPEERAVPPERMKKGRQNQCAQQPRQRASDGVCRQIREISKKEEGDEKKKVKKKASHKPKQGLELHLMFT